jgi:hypothetical protein
MPSLQSPINIVRFDQRRGGHAVLRTCDDTCPCLPNPRVPVVVRGDDSGRDILQSERTNVPRAMASTALSDGRADAGAGAGCVLAAAGPVRARAFPRLA